MKKAYLLLLPLIFILGCASTQSGSSLKFDLFADPGTVLQGSSALVHMDFTNQDIKKIYNVEVFVFNPGLMKETDPACSESGKAQFLLPGEFRSYACSFQAPEINQDRMTTQLDAKATFDSTLSAAQQLEMYSELEYNNRLAKGGLETKPQSYVYSDRNLQLTVDFTEPLPLIAKENRKLFVTFTLQNIGSGMISKINPKDITIDQHGNVILVSPAGEGGYEPCRLQEQLVASGKTFPTFSCQILLPENMNMIQNYNFFIDVDYSYEIRNSISIDIIR
jgi:hypothetical protein